MKLKQPLILYTDLELSGMLTSHKDFKWIKQRTIGESWYHKNSKLDFDVVYMNVDNSDFVWQLIDTVVHELVHLKYPKLKHGNRFQNRINNIIIS